jgi:hypothetical protein
MLKTAKVYVEKHEVHVEKFSLLWNYETEVGYGWQSTHPGALGVILVACESEETENGLCKLPGD